ncbi:MAG: nucleotidyltransferase family protein [Acidobacteriota bacterium]
MIAVFRSSDPYAARAALFCLKQKQWVRSYHWLDVSGTALYLLHRIEVLGITDAVPQPVLGRLRRNLADSHHRVDTMFAEFVELNNLFTEAAISSCNLKGFTLSPDSCPNPELRCQLDFDFLVDGRSLDLCRNLLERRGYELRGRGPTVLEFKTPSETIADIADLYRSKRQFSVEVHFSVDGESAPTRDPRLDRTRIMSMRGFSFSALSPVDQFVNQATHLFGHLCGANTRVAWLLEFNNHMQARANDAAFWKNVCEVISLDRESTLALGAVCQLAEELLAIEIPAVLSQALSTHRSGEISRWVELYGVRALLADSPGTKLGLLLKEQLEEDGGAWQKSRRKALLPLHRAPRLLPIRRSEGWHQIRRSEALQLRYDLFRLRFHVVEGARYLYEWTQWRRGLALPHPPVVPRPSSGRVVPE